MRKILFRLLLYFFPFGLYLVLPFFIFIKTRELSRIDKLITDQIQSHREKLIGFAYINPTAYYKFNYTVAAEPEVLVLGASRVMQFRQGFFYDSVNFFNAGGAINHMQDFKTFLDLIPQEKSPKMIIADLTWCWFHPSNDYVGITGLDQYTKSNYGIQYFINKSRNVYSDWFDNKFSISDIMDSGSSITRIGMNAFVHHSGFRNDGSMRYGEQLSNPNDSNLPDFLFRNTLMRIEQGSDRFIYGDLISVKSLAHLESFYSTCSARGIKVISIMPPFAPSIYATLVSRRGDYEYLFALPDVLKKINRKYDFEFYDYSDVEKLGAKDSEMLDGFHGSEVVYARLLKDMLIQQSTLTIYSNENKLTQILTKPKTDLTLFGD